MPWEVWDFPKAQKWGHNFLTLLFREEIFCVYLNSGQSRLKDLSFTVLPSLFLCWIFFPKRDGFPFSCLVKSLALDYSSSEFSLSTYYGIKFRGYLSWPTKWSDTFYILSYMCGGKHWYLFLIILTQQLPLPGYQQALWRFPSQPETRLQIPITEWIDKYIVVYLSIPIRENSVQ